MTTNRISAHGAEGVTVSDQDVPSTLLRVAPKGRSVHRQEGAGVFNE